MRVEYANSEAFVLYRESQTLKLSSQNWQQYVVVFPKIFIVGVKTYILFRPLMEYILLLPEEPLIFTSHCIACK